MAKPVPVWTGVVTPEGVVKLDARELFHGYIKRLANQTIQIVVKKRGRPKSSSQLGYLFGVLYPVIADDMGYRDYETEQVHDAIIRHLRGLKAEPNPLGLRVSLAEMTHEEVSAYIEDVRHWAVTEYGIVTPDSTKAIAA